MNWGMIRWNLETYHEIQESWSWYVYIYIYTYIKNHQKSVQSMAEVRAISWMWMNQSLAEKSPRRAHSRVTAIHQNTKGLPSFEGSKVPAEQTPESPPLALQTTLLPALLCIANNHSSILNFERRRQKKNKQRIHMKTNARNQTENPPYDPKRSPERPPETTPRTTPYSWVVKRKVQGHHWPENKVCNSLRHHAPPSSRTTK